MKQLDRAALAALGGVLAYGAFQWGGVVRTGLHYTPGNTDDLAAEAEWAWAHPEEMAVMGRAARAEYEAKYIAERNYKMLMEIYQRVLGARA